MWGFLQTLNMYNGQNKKKINKMSLIQLLGIVRHTLTAIGTYLMIAGINVDGTKWELGIGATLTLASVVWSIINKKDLPQDPTTGK